MNSFERGSARRAVASVMSGAAWLCEREPLLAAGMILGLAYYYLVPSPLLALPGLLVFAVGAWLRLDLALCLLPLAFPYWFVPKRVGGHAVIPLSESALAVCLAVAIAHWLTTWRIRGGLTWARRAGQVLWGRLGIWMVLGAALLVVGTTAGVLIAVRPREALRAWRWQVVEPLVYLALVVMYVRRPRMARWLIWSLIGSALVLAGLAAVQVLWLHATFTPVEAGNRLVPFVSAGGGVPRATAFVYGSGNSLGAWLERALPVALALAVIAPSRRWERLAAGLCALAYVPALIWSDSRGAWAGAALACVVVGIVGLRRLWVALGVALGVALAAVAVALWQREALVRAALAGHGGSGEVRTLVWLAALRMIRDHPLLGVGPDQFLYYYDPAYTRHPYLIARVNGHLTPAVSQPDLAHPHNLLLDLWLSGGVLGLAGMLAILANLWARCWRLWREAGGWSAAAGLGVGASVLAGVAHGMVDSAYFVPDLALALWWAVAVVVVLERGARRERRAPDMNDRLLPPGRTARGATYAKP
jgi:putative inorganic carbon (HCO3(-)) transporter